jgi:hypothetical protein
MNVVKEYEQANNKGRHEEQERQWTFSRTYNKGVKSRKLTRAVPSWHAVPILSSSFQAIAFRVPTTSRRSMINVWILYLHVEVDRYIQKVSPG